MNNNDSTPRTKNGFVLEGLIELANILNFSVEVSPYSSFNAWVEGTFNKKGNSANNVLNISKNKSATSLENLSADPRGGTIRQLTDRNALVKEDGRTPYTFFEIMAILYGATFLEEARQALGSFISQRLPYQEGIDLIRAAMGDRTVEDFKDTIPNLVGYLKGDRLDAHDISLVMVFLHPPSTQLFELYRIYGHSFDNPTPRKTQKHPESNAQDAPINGNGNGTKKPKGRE
ncbi:MAG: hypothetical protein AAGA75_19680 [Cyanobacteria bacterium P01_E01_bin.6]